MIGPEPHDELFQPYWEGTALGELRVQQCTVCESHRWPPRPVCTSCRSFDSIWRTVPDFGRLYSWTRVEHQSHPEIPPPYTVVIVELDTPDGIRFVGQLRGGDPLALVPGQMMRAVFEPVQGAGYCLVQWTPVDTHMTDRSDDR